MSFLAEWLFNLLGWLKDWFIDKWRLYKNPFIFYVITVIIYRIADVPPPLEGTGSAFRSGIMPPMTKFQNVIFTITYINVLIVVIWVRLIREREKHKDD
ncbi:hypothetical protein PT286_00210 [Neisseriaceae bacterium ESL0693]|nr:hypothetical protein [Neisseriaceae bacterium ESL0693]